jgi:microcystin-dependent protein
MAATARRRSRCPICAVGFPCIRGNNFILAETGGVEQVTLTVAQMPAHTHPMLASSNAASAATPTNQTIGKSTGFDAFINAQPTLAIKPSITPVGGNQPHDNMQPYLCVDFIISLFGLFPSPT